MSPHRELLILEKCLDQHGYDVHKSRSCSNNNKRDLPGAVGVRELEATLYIQISDHKPYYFEAVANRGQGSVDPAALVRFIGSSKGGEAGGSPLAPNGGKIL